MRKITQYLIDILLRIVQRFNPNVIDLSVLPPDTYVQRIARVGGFTINQNELWIFELKSTRPKEDHLTLASYEDNMQLAFYESVTELQDYRRSVEFFKGLPG